MPINELQLLKQKLIKSSLPIILEKTYLKDRIFAEPDDFIDQSWLKSEILTDFVSPSPNIINFLFQDVYKLAIATSRRHEIWAGAQMKAAEILRNIIKDCPGSGSNASEVFKRGYIQFYKHWQRLEIECLNHSLPIPNCSIWSNELLSVRQDFHGTPRSRFRRFIRNLKNAECEQSMLDQVIILAFDTYELLWTLPDPALKFIRKYAQESNEDCPSIEDFGDWLSRHTNLQNCLTKLQNQDKVARNNLVTGYFRSALRLAHNYTTKNISIDYLDLVQEAAIGLITAAEKYDYRRSTQRYITYANSWMWQRIERALAEKSRIIRIPVHRFSELSKLEAAYKACLEDCHLKPTLEALTLKMENFNEIDHKMIIHHIKTGKVLKSDLRKKWHDACEKTKQLLNDIEQPISLSVEVPHNLVEPEFYLEQEDVCNLQEIIYDEQQTALLEDHLELNDLENLCEELYASVSKKQEQIIKWRFGMKDGSEHVLEDIAQIFGVTREGIRQSEQSAFRKFKGNLMRRQRKERLQIPSRTHQSFTWSKDVTNYFLRTHSYWTTVEEFDNKFGLSFDEQDRTWLDTLVEKLPSIGWQQRIDPTRRDQFTLIFQALKSPTHYKDIAEAFNETTEQSWDEMRIYSFLNSIEDTFILLGDGVFSLNEWERKRCFEDKPILPFCPMPLPDLPEQRDTFLESIVVAEDYLKCNPRASDFLRYMLTWSQTSLKLSKSAKQSILNAYYIVGLIPYTFYYEGEDPLLHSTILRSDLPTGNDIFALRQYSLQCLTQRLVAMPEFWWILQQNQPGRGVDFATHFVDFHLFELNDVDNRLRLLTGLGAVKRLPYDAFELTSLGHNFALDWGLKPDIQQIDSIMDIYKEDTSYEDEFDFIDFDAL